MFEWCNLFTEMQKQKYTSTMRLITKNTTLQHFPWVLAFVIFVPIGLPLVPCLAVKKECFMRERLSVKHLEQGCQIFLGTKYQNGKNIPNYHELCQMFIKYNK
jgi:hypothetical protein